VKGCDRPFVSSFVNHWKFLMAIKVTGSNRLYSKLTSLSFC
jgi:hypothetical protein